MQKTVIIVAGGVGRRMNFGIPKQFIEICGKPVIIHSIEKFYHYDNLIKIILVLPAEHITLWNRIVEKYNFIIQLQTIYGGDSRFQSVKNGLDLVENGIVAIHDAVRPLVSTDTIARVFETASHLGNAVPSIAVNESLRTITNSGNLPLDRSQIRIIQTPQCFDTELIKKAYGLVNDEHFTDDASVLENIGEKINLIEGNQENIKITHAIDIKIAASLLTANNSPR